MRIAQISTLATPVRRDNSGSIESLVWSLDRELTRLGHEVTVFAIAGSEVSGELVATLPGSYGCDGAPDDWQLCEWINICRAVAQSGRFDMLHSHAYLWGMPLDPLSRAPMMHTIHIQPEEDAARLWAMSPGAWVTAISAYQWSAFPELTPAGIVHHGVDPDAFTFRAEPKDYVCYLGRFTWGKGPIEAIAAARAAGVPILLAGPENDYYREQVAPLVDGRTAIYVGEVAGDARDRLLGGARALVYPVQYPEPFGLVMIEAMMCGTPVVATNLGAVPEIVDEGITGFVVADPSQLPSRFAAASQLDRRQLRERAAARFSARRMAQDYVRIYQRIVAERSR